MSQRLKLTGYLSAVDIEAVFSSSIMSSVARVDEISIDSMAISSTDPNWPTDQQDYEWLCSTIRDALVLNGILHVQITPIPPRSE
jgi:hypothetical protein